LSGKIQRVGDYIFARRFRPRDFGVSDLHTVLVLGGYGNFGAYICRALANDPDIRLLIAGRSQQKAQQFAVELGLPARRGQYIDADVTNLAGELRGLGVETLINTVGPFQWQDYRVANACIEAGCNYIDLADAREFVANISQLNAAARKAGVLVTSGASSVPALSAAVVDHFLPQFSRLDSVRHAIVSGASTPGLATLRAVLGYCGKPFIRLENGVRQNVFGWQGLQRREYPSPIGPRWLGNCDVPDLVLFPQRYPSLQTVTFHAGLGIPASHPTTWLLSWLVRWGWIGNLASWSRPLRWLSLQLERFGTPNSAMHIEMSGLGLQGEALTRTWHIVALNNDGPNIPCGAAIALARKLARGETLPKGALPCVGLLTLEEYLAALHGLDIRQVLS